MNVIAKENAIYASSRMIWERFAPHFVVKAGPGSHEGYYTYRLYFDDSRAGWAFNDEWNNLGDVRYFAEERADGFYVTYPV